MMKKLVFIFLFVLIASNLLWAPDIVHDPTNFVEQMAQTLLLLDTVTNQVKMIEEAYKNAERQIKMMTQLPAKIINAAMDYVDDFKDGINEIFASVDQLTISITDSFVDAKELFIPAGTDSYDYWFNPTLDADSRADIIEEDIKKAFNLRKLAGENSLEAHLLSDRLKTHLENSYENISDILRNVSGSESTVELLQAQNLLSSEIHAELAQIAQILDVSARALTESISYAKEEKYLGTIGDMEDPFAECPEGYYRDPITHKCEPYGQSIKKILKDSSEDTLEELDMYQKDRELLLGGGS